MDAHVKDTHAKLGECAELARRTEQAERQILAKATEQLERVQSDLRAAQAESMTSGGERYMELIAERGRLQQVIAQAQQVLAA